MLLFRYECEHPSLKEPHTGICTCIEELPLPIGDDWNDVVFLMEDFLQSPSVDMTNTISFFKPKGHKKVRKGVRQMAKDIQSIQAKIGLWIIESDDVESSIIFNDRYQVILKRTDDVISHMKFVKYL